jgi:YgiT-type zinc finger domain-containing protein
MRCAWCKSEVVPSERRITIDRGKVFEEPLPAVECTACGKMFAPDEEEDDEDRAVGPPARRE